MSTNQILPSGGAPPLQILEHAPIMISYVGPDYRYCYANARYADVLGQQPQEVVGKHVREVVGEAAFEALSEYLRRAFGGERVRYRQWVRLRGGGRRFWSTTYQPHIVDGRVQGIFVYVEDATDKQLAEEAQRESDERFRAIFENAAVGIALIAADGRITAVNQQVCEVLGYSPEEMLDRLGSDFGHPDDEERTQEAARRLIAGEARHVAIEKRYLRKGGGVVWTQISFSLLRDPSGRPQFFLGVIDDITARKEAQRALAESERMYRSVFDNAAVGMSRVSVEGRWLEVNDRLCAKLGYSREELLGLTVQGVTHPDDLENDLSQAKRLFRGEVDFYELDKRFLRKDGSVLWAHLTASGVRDDGGEIIYLVGIVEDIMARKEAETALQALNLALESRVEERTAELMTVNQELDAFNYSVSHDLRAPLRGIDGFSQALLEDFGERLDERGRHYLERVKAGASRMGELIDALLMLSRLTRGELDRRRVDLCELVHEVASNLRQEEPQRRVTFEVSQEVHVHGDPRLLRVLVRNLLENAWKFTRDAQEARIEVGCTRLGREAVCFVRDNGVGFDPRYADKLFVPFQRLHGPAEFEGLGIGLATVQRIINRHGGRIWAEGAPGKGAAFYFTLPASEPG